MAVKIGSQLGHRFSKSITSLDFRSKNEMELYTKEWVFSLPRKFIEAIFDPKNGHLQYI